MEKSGLAAKGHVEWVSSAASLSTSLGQSADALTAHDDRSRLVTVLLLRGHSAELRL